MDRRLCVAVALAWMAAAEADIYKYVDARGRVYYADEPKHAGYRLFIRTPRPRAGKPRIGGGASLAKRRARYDALIDRTARKYGLDPQLLHAVIRAESAYDPGAVSPKGAVGLMQLLPATARRYGVVDLRDPKANLEAGARYLKDLLKQFGDVKLALAAYNAGEAAVQKYGNRVPPYRETRRYVARVMQFYESPS